jgi:hypothetical protein
MNEFLMEKANMKVIADPVDFNTAAITGGRIGMKGYDRITIMLIMNGGTSITNRTFDLKQHNAASSGTTKALSVDNPYYHKVGSATKFTKVTPASATDSYDLLTLIGDNKSVIVFEVLAEDLDVNNNFAWVSINAGDSGAASLGTIIAFAHEPGTKPAYSLDL